MPRAGRLLAETVAFHRDPLGALRRARAARGPVFGLRLVNAGPVVVVADPEAALELVGADPGWARAGEARRAILPFASPRSSFGGDGERHAAARAPALAALGPEAVDPRRAAMAAIAREHVARWPRARPFRVLPRMRALLDDVMARLLLGVDDEARARAIAAAVQ